LDNKSDFFFVTKYGDGLLPTNMYLTLCEECMHTNAWTSFPVTLPNYIEYRTLKWKLALKEPRPLHSLKRLRRPIIAAGVRVLLDKKPEAKKTLPSTRLKLNTKENTVMRSPLSNLEHNLNQIGFNIHNRNSKHFPQNSRSPKPD
jgi:hypothetical protein